MIYRLILLLFPYLISGCISDTPKFDRISTSFNQFALQFGANHILTTGGGSKFDSCTNVHIDKYENIYCGGYTDDVFAEPQSDGANLDTILIKLDPNGNFLWARQLGANTVFENGDNDGNEICRSVTTDGDGNVYCYGYSDGDQGDIGHSGGDSDLTLIKFSPGGNLLWVKQWGTPTNENPGNIINPGDGYLYVSGSTRGDMTDGIGSSVGTRDMFMQRLSLNGDILWTQQTGYVDPIGPAPLDSVCQDMTYDKQGGLVCVGSINDAIAVTPRDLLMWKVSLDGVESWKKTFVSAGDEFCSAATSDLQGNIYCSGTTVGGAFVAAESTASWDFVVIKLDPSGGEIWRKQLGMISVGAAAATGAELSGDILVGRDGQLYLSGHTTGALAEVNGGTPPPFNQAHRDIVLLKLSSTDGTVQFIRQFGDATRVVPAGQTGNSDTQQGLIQDPLGNFIFTGYTNGSLIEANQDAGGNFGDVYIFRTDSQGLR